MELDNSLTNYEKAYVDYIKGMKYRDIAVKYDVAESTVKTWKRRYGWEDREERQKKYMMQLTKETKKIHEDLLNQLKNNGVIGQHYVDLVETYMELFNIKNNLIKDIKDRGVAVEWHNGKQLGIKKNDSIGELNKTIAQMLNILSDLGLKPSAMLNNFGGDDFDL